MHIALFLNKLCYHTLIPNCMRATCKMSRDSIVISIQKDSSQTLTFTGDTFLKNAAIGKSMNVGALFEWGKGG